MSTIEIILVIIFLFIAYKAYKALEKMTDSYDRLGEQINQSLANIKYSVDNISSTFGDEFLGSFLRIPNSKEELDKKKDTLVKCYANYLSQNEGLSSEDAILQANFEVDKFGVETVLREINWDKAMQNGDSEKKFINSTFFKNEVSSYWTVGIGDKKIVLPIDLFRPIYEFIKNSNYKDGESVVLNKRQDSSYYSYIKNRAILFNLKKLGVIKFSENENKVDLSELSFKFISDDVSVIKKTINKGYSDFPGYFLSEDNKEYDEHLSEHESAEQLFEKI